MADRDYLNLAMDPGLLSSFGGGSFGGGSYGQPAERLNLKALLPLLGLRGPNLEAERAKGTVAALRGKNLRPADHSDKYGQRGGGALAVSDFASNLADTILQKRAEDAQATKEGDLAKASESAGAAALKAMGAADYEEPPDVQPQAKIDTGRAAGTPLTQDVPPPQPQMGPGGVTPQPPGMQLPPGMTMQDILAAYAVMQGGGSGG